MVGHYSIAVNFPSGGGFVARATRGPLLRRLTRGLAVIRAGAAFIEADSGLEGRRAGATVGRLTVDAQTEACVAMEAVDGRLSASAMELQAMRSRPLIESPEVVAVAVFAYLVSMVNRDDFRLASPVLSASDQRVAVAWKGVS